MEIVVVWYVLLTHFIADFVFQTDAMATKKRSSFKWLSHHCMLYGVATAIMWWFAFNTNIFAVLILVGIPHLMVDFVTSKITGYYYSKKNWHKFFVVIGLDQLIHYTLLLLTLRALYT